MLEMSGCFSVCPSADRNGGKLSNAAHRLSKWMGWIKFWYHRHTRRFNHVTTATFTIWTYGNVFLGSNVITWFAQDIKLASKLNGFPGGLAYTSFYLSFQYNKTTTLYQFKSPDCVNQNYCLMLASAHFGRLDLVFRQKYISFRCILVIFRC